MAISAGLWYGVSLQEAKTMRNTLEDLYYGNITPNAQDMAPNSELKQATDRVTRFGKATHGAARRGRASNLGKTHRITAGN